MMMGGCGRCTGFGQLQLFSKSTNSPWNSASSFVHSCFIARIFSRTSLRRVFGSTPWFSISSWFQP